MGVYISNHNAITHIKHIVSQGQGCLVGGPFQQVTSTPNATSHEHVRLLDTRVCTQSVGDTCRRVRQFRKALSFYSTLTSHTGAYLHLGEVVSFDAHQKPLLLVYSAIK